MPQTDVATYADVIARIGVPSALVLFGIFCFVWLGRWIAPRIDAWVGQYFVMQEERTKMFELTARKCESMQQDNLRALQELGVLVKTLDARLSMKG